MTNRFLSYAPGTAAAILLSLLLPAAAAREAAADGSRWWNSASGAFRLSYSSRLDPIVINRIHRWELHLTDAGGNPVVGAEILAAGGMPAHDHGLPTKPQITRELGEGRYLLDGMRFHMHGFWEVTFDIHSAGHTDSVVVTLEL
jgi:hypothetical protein